MTSFDIDKERAEQDLGYLAREVLGFNYFHDDETGELNYECDYRDNHYDTAGIVNWGPHKEMVDFLSSQAKSKMLMASRGSLKTTLGMAWLTQNIVRNCNIRLLVHMETYRKAVRTVSTVKNFLTNNEKIRYLWGDLRGEKWADEGFIVQRTRDSRELTLYASGTDSFVTGDHPDKIWIDDPVSWQQARSPDMMEKSIDCIKALVHLLIPGGELNITMTPYDENDVSGHVKSMEGEFEVLELPCGMKAVEVPGEGYQLEGEPLFPHMPESYLRRKLHMLKDPAEFNAQYALSLQNPADQVFHRHHFVSAPWDNRYARCNSYILTDTAVTDQDHACFSVIAVVVLDWDDVAYIADLRVGRWKPNHFVAEMVETVRQWSTQLRIVGLCMESVTSNKVYRGTIESELHRAGLNPQWIDVPRGLGLPGKKQRIRGLTSRLASHKLRVLPSVPEYFDDLGRMRLLWKPDGYLDASKNKRLPDGELVRQFVNFRFSGTTGTFLDIPDALADLETVDSKGRRLCTPSPRPSWTGEGQNMSFNRRIKRTLPDKLRRRGNVLKSDYWKRLASRIS